MLNMFRLKNNLILDILKEKYLTLNELRKCEMCEIGCGDGEQSRFLCNFVKTYNGIDKFQKQIKKAQEMTHPLYENLNFFVDDIIGDITNPNINNKFNIIFAQNTIHFTNEKINKAFDNMYKLLK